MIGCLRGCGKAARKRGLCLAHYMAAYVRVKAGRTTWAKEVLAGRALAPSNRRWLPCYARK